MSTQWKDELTDNFCEAILTLKDKKEVYDFLEDVATIGEIRAFSQRFEVARLLIKGNTYPQITSKTGASTATISRVKRCVDYGTDGFKTAVERME